MSYHGVAVLKHYEGCHLVAYLCPAGKWTIGHGHTGRDVYPGKVITQAEADELLMLDDLPMKTAAVLEVAPTNITQAQLDALTLWAYNCKGWRSATLLNKLRQGDERGAFDGLREWCKAEIDGVMQPLLGLRRRREAERALAYGATARQAINIGNQILSL